MKFTIVNFKTVDGTPVKYLIKSKEYNFTVNMNCFIFETAFECIDNMVFAYNVFKAG